MHPIPIGLSGTLSSNPWFISLNHRCINIRRQCKQQQNLCTLYTYQCTCNSSIPIGWCLWWLRPLDTPVPCSLQPCVLNPTEISWLALEHRTLCKGGCSWHTGTYAVWSTVGVRVWCLVDVHGRSLHCTPVSHSAALYTHPSVLS